MKTAIVGMGRWGKNLLKEFNEQAEVVWVCTPNKDRSSEFLQENYPSIKHTINLADITKDASIQAVVVATPINTHFELAMKVLEAGKHLFLEKPGGTKSEELEKLCQKAEKNSLTFVVGYEFPHHPAWRKILELMPLEDIRSIHMEWSKWGSFEEHSISNLLCHDISLLYSVSQEIQPIQHFTHKVISHSDIVEAAFDCKKFPSISYINRVSPNKQKTVTVVGDQTAFVWSGDNLHQIDYNSQNLISVPINESSALTMEVKDFIKAITSDKKPLCNGQFALRVFGVVEQLLLE